LLVFNLEIFDDILSWPVGIATGDTRSIGLTASLPMPNRHEFLTTVLAVGSGQTWTSPNGKAVGIELMALSFDLVKLPFPDPVPRRFYTSLFLPSVLSSEFARQAS